ncbi:acyl-CoA dehydrogenase domain-containing protein [Rhizobium sp. PDO1-076]|uniref:acyl-CoA dehydrogenase family protein n=1 Tax=Rhizobium sp. PDO1-076 TaxID=1125979 RepID=UPI00024E2CB5|nr:acyl-CoA dehydrogenase family protein [Rhizobium sp. PDO1-076]EHS53003.1 acyl-CoA dehydrogenase domain-containing protein [Rhizobium sp. PDO1-076]
MMKSASDRLRPVPAKLPTEGQVLAVVESIVLRPVSDGQDMAAATLAKSGLLAISIPAIFGGADISNVVVAEAISRLSTWNMRTAELFVHHLIALELLRTSGTTEQRRAVYSRVALGEVFHFSAGPTVPPMARLVRSGLSFMVEPAPSMPPPRGTDWHVLIATAAGMGEVAFILSFEDAQPSDGDVSPTAPPVSPDNVLVLGLDALSLAALMQAFLRGAICRGAIDAELGKYDIGDTSASAIEFELLDAIVLKVASIIDGIQVDEPTLDLAQTERLCEALQTACLRCTDEVTPPQ